MNWAAALYTVGIWTLAASIWNATFRIWKPLRGGSLSLHVALDLLPGLLLAFIVAYFA
jgi:hypothetical protein